MKATKMLAILVLVLGLVGNVSGQNSPVKFRATVTADEDHGVIPVCYGDYFVEVAIDEILEDAAAVLAGITSVQVCYNDAQGLVLGESVEVYGYYWGGVCPKQYCRRVQILDESYYIMRIEGYGDNDWMVSDSNMYSIPSGNVGIGTASPQEKMHVVGNAIIEAEAGAGFGAPLRVEKDGAGRQLAAFFSNPRDGATEVEIQMGIGTMLPSAWSLKAASGLFSIANVAVLPPALNIRNTGEVGIGTITPQGKLDVNGSIYQRGSQLHADYVFEPGYELESIEEHSQFMWQHKHLKAIPKAKVDGNGQEIVDVGAHRKGIVEELEKAHIYIEQLHKRIKALEEKLVKLETGISAAE